MPKLSQYTSPRKEPSATHHLKVSKDIGSARTPVHESSEALKLVSDFEKRICHHGQRRFRWPDGSLQDVAPPPNPYAVASRRRWAPVVHHCRSTGSHTGISRTGRSSRYNIGVPYAAHAACLESIGLRPETDEEGRWVGYDSDKERPLKDPEHPFNAAYAQVSSRVLDGSYGRLLNLV